MSSETPPPGDQIVPGTVVDDFEILEQIGKGGFSHVHIARHIPTNNYCAAKVIELATMKPEEFQGILREVSVFMQVEHPNICNLYRLSVLNESLIFFMECAPRGTLLSYVNSKGGLTEFEAQRLFIQLFRALRHLHIYHFLVHRDLKLENILLDSKGNVKLTDFGLAGTYYNYIMHTFVGTPGYQPPEILAGSEYNEKCDVWSLGVCLYAMLVGSLPFATQTHNFRALIQEAMQFKYPKTFSPALVDLLKKMFEIRPAERPSLTQLQSHPWLRGLEQLATNIAPQPIVFYKVKDAQGILKYKRRPVRADPAVLEKCEGIDKEALVGDLKNGVTNAATTTYFFRLWPLETKPEIKMPEPKKPPPIPGARKREMTVKGSAPSMEDLPPKPRARTGSVHLTRPPVASPLAMARERKVTKPSMNGTPVKGLRNSVGVFPKKLF